MALGGVFMAAVVSGGVFVPSRIGTTLPACRRARSLTSGRRNGCFRPAL